MTHRAIWRDDDAGLPKHRLTLDRLDSMLRRHRHGYSLSHFLDYFAPDRDGPKFGERRIAEALSNAEEQINIESITWEWHIKINGSVKGFVDLRYVSLTTRGNYSLRRILNFEVQTRPVALPELLRKVQYYYSFLPDYEEYFIVAPRNDADAAIAKQHGFPWINLDDVLGPNDAVLSTPTGPVA